MSNRDAGIKHAGPDDWCEIHRDYCNAEATEKDRGMTIRDWLESQHPELVEWWDGIDLSEDEGTEA